MILAVMGNVLISAGLIATKGAHMQLDKIKSRLPEGQAPPSYVKLPGWWLGFLCTVGGELGNFMAYGTSTLSAQGATTPPNAIAPQTTCPVSIQFIATPTAACFAAPCRLP